MLSGRQGDAITSVWSQQDLRPPKKKPPPIPYKSTATLLSKVIEDTVTSPGRPSRTEPEKGPIPYWAFSGALPGPTTDRYLVHSTSGMSSSDLQSVRLPQSFGASRASHLLG